MSQLKWQVLCPRSHQHRSTPPMTPTSAMASSAALLRHLNRLVFVPQTWHFKSSPGKTLRRSHPKQIRDRPIGSITGRWRGGSSRRASFLPILSSCSRSRRSGPNIEAPFVAAILIVALQSLIVAALLFQRRRRLRAENLLKESEERMTFAAAAANIGLWQFDRDRNELWATEHCRSMFGIARDAPLTRNTFLSAVHPDDLQTATQAPKVIGNRATCHQRRPNCPAGRGDALGSHACPIPFRRAAAESKHLGGIFVDITEQKSAEAEVALQRLEVEHLMRVSVLGELSGSIAHEVNQPLTAILSNAQAALHLLAREFTGSRRNSRCPRGYCS